MTANQVSTSAPEDEEVLISIMDTMKIDDMDVDMDTMTIDNMDMESDWLDMDTIALVCNTSTLPQTSTNDKQQLQDQEICYSDFDPFTPDYKSVDAQQVISNLPQIKDCEFDHAYILHHLEQL